jgi:hypothetical protein
MLPFISELRLESTMIDINYYICKAKEIIWETIKKKETSQ